MNIREWKPFGEIWLGIAVAAFAAWYFLGREYDGLWLASVFGGAISAALLWRLGMYHLRRRY